MNYKIIITYDAEYKGYVVDVPELPGCMSQGKTIDEALTNVKDAIKGWLDAENKKGISHPSYIKEVFLGEVSV